LRASLYRYGALSALLAAFWFLPLYQWIAQPLVLSTPLTRADAIVVLGGGVNEWGHPTESTEERVHYGVGLYWEEFAPKLVLSTGMMEGFNEARVMRQAALALGVPEQDIVLEEESHNTYENILFVHRLFQQRGWQRPIVVSSPYHMRRIDRVYKKVGSEVSPLYAPVRPSVFDRGGLGAHRLRQFFTVLREYLALGFYWMRGRI
jgi:uncharacterized SAM-binding protein YcdF (DUF218 family)